MRVAILGYDIEGRSSYEYFRDQGHQVTILDQQANKVVPLDADSVLGPNYLQNLTRFDLIVRTAGLPPAKIFEANPGLQADKVTSQINQFFKASPTKQIIGVTGTKGKGTTSTLITKILQAAGFDAQLGGNIGIPALELLPSLTPESWAVLELSSFQLSDFTNRIPLAVCLMVVPEHLNWHRDEADYYAAKQHIFAGQTKVDTAIYYGDSPISKQLAGASPGRQLPYGVAPGAAVVHGAVVIDGIEICQLNELQLRGAHNWQNVCAAVTAAWQVTQDVTALRSVLTTFSGLEHRLELVRRFQDVAYYDDSFGTTPETAIVALAAFTEPKILILGGSDKGADYNNLAAAVARSNVRQVLLIGQQAGRLQAALEQAGVSNFLPGGSTMAAIVQTARELVQPGDVVLLSTGCASFDMFLNYKDRAAQFAAAVQALS